MNRKKAKYSIHLRHATASRQVSHQQNLIPQKDFVYRVAKCELMEFVEIIREIKTKNVSLLKISMLVQTLCEILPQLCSNDSIQILLKMAWFFNVKSQANLKRILWGHQSLTVAICSLKMLNLGMEACFIF